MNIQKCFLVNGVPLSKLSAPPLWPFKHLMKLRNVIRNGRNVMHTIALESNFKHRVYALFHK